MKDLNKRGVIAAELLAIIVIPGSLTFLLICFIYKKLGLNERLKNFKLQKEN